MALIVESQAYILYETVKMVYAWVNDEPITFHRDRMNRGNKVGKDTVWYRRLTRLQEILEDCCRDINREDQTVAHFFRKIDTGLTSGHTFLAGALTYAFMQYKDSDFDGEIQALKDNWKRLQTEGIQLGKPGMHGVSVQILEPGAPKVPLHTQIYALDYSPELRLELMNLFLSYETELDRLAELLRPYAQRLRQHLDAEPWLMDTVVEYWQEHFQKTTPEAFAQNALHIKEKLPEMPNRRVCFSLMDCAYVSVEIREMEEGTGYGLFVLGCAAMEGFGVLDDSISIEQTLSKIRSLSDWHKFEILRRLSRREGYCQQLAEELNSHTGNISRNLTTLWKDGFLKRREGENRVYYETDTEALATFLKKVYVILADRDLI